MLTQWEFILSQAAPNVNRDMQYLGLLSVSTSYEASASTFSTYIAIIYDIVLQQVIYQRLGCGHLVSRLHLPD